MDLLEALKQASSPHPELRAAGDALLSQWQHQPSFFSSLLTLYASSAYDHKLRSLAIIYLKNGIDKYWRKSAKDV